MLEQGDADVSTGTSGRIGIMDSAWASVPSDKVYKLAGQKAIPTAPGMQAQRKPGATMEARVIPPQAPQTKSVGKIGLSKPAESTQKKLKGDPKDKTSKEAMSSRTAEEDLLDWLDS